jgi:hypothetical protein
MHCSRTQVSAPHSRTNQDRFADAPRWQAGKVKGRQRVKLTLFETALIALKTIFRTTWQQSSEKPSALEGANGSTPAGSAGSMGTRRPAAQSAPSLKLWSVSDLRAAGRGRRAQNRALVRGYPI